MKDKNGNCRVDDFISLMMLMTHHRHIDLRIGFMIENNEILRQFEHYKILNPTKMSNAIQDSFCMIKSQGFS